MARAVRASVNEMRTAGKLEEARGWVVALASAGTATQLKVGQCSRDIGGG